MSPDGDRRFPELMIGPLRSYMGVVELGNGRQVHVACMRTVDGIMMAVIRGGAGVYSRPVSTADVSRDFPCLPAQDRANFADLINDQLQPGTPRLGDYQEI